MSSPPSTPDSRFSAALARFVRGQAGEDTELVQLGLDSLTLIRIIVHTVGEDSEDEIDLGRIEGLRTVGELRAWVAGGTGAVAR